MNIDWNYSVSFIRTEWLKEKKKRYNKLFHIQTFYAAGVTVIVVVNETEQQEFESGIRKFAIHIMAISLLLILIQLFYLREKKNKQQQQQQNRHLGIKFCLLTYFSLSKNSLKKLYLSSNDFFTSQI